jgi:Flp pilus assembly pilin Flp
MSLNRFVHSFWTEEAGAVFTSELVLVATVTVLGLIAGLSELRDSVHAELRDLSQSVQAVEPNMVGFGAPANAPAAPVETLALSDG